MIASKADINARDEGCFKQTPLIYAVNNRQREVMELLIAKGANINIRDDG